MKKNAFTLVELLAVIVILGIIMAIASSSLMKAKMETNKREAKQIKKSIEDIGLEVYFDNDVEYDTLKNGEELEFRLDELSSYLKSTTIKNPAGGEEPCTGLLRIKKTSNGPEFESCLCCPGIEDFEESCD